MDRDHKSLLVLALVVPVVTAVCIVAALALAVPVVMKRAARDADGGPSVATQSIGTNVINIAMSAPAVSATNIINVSTPVTARIEGGVPSALPVNALVDGMRSVQVTEQDKSDALAALILINHINWVVAKVKTHNNPAVLEEEYKNISQNALLLDAIKDEQIITLICDIMDAIVELRIDGKKREMLKEELDQAMSDALYDAASGVSIRGATPLGMAVSALTSVATAAANYKRAKRNLERNHKKMTFALDESKMRYLNELNKSLLKNYWFVIQKYGIPDPYRVTEDDVASLIDRLKDPDVARRLRFLVSNEEKYKMLPNYWYWRGQTAYELNMPNQADSALAMFQELQTRGCKVLRYDTTAANVALLRAKIMIDRGVKDKDEIRRQLDIIVANSSDDEWAKRYFCAMVYLQKIGSFEDAEAVLRPAIDKMESDRQSQLVKLTEEFDESRSAGRNEIDAPVFGDALYMCKTLLLKAGVDEVGPEKRREILGDICDSATASMREKLFCYCSMGYRQALEKMLPDINRMRVFSEDKTLRLILPMSWVVTRDGNPVAHFTEKMFGVEDMKSVDFANKKEFQNVDEEIDKRELDESNGLQCVKGKFSYNWKKAETVVVTFRYDQKTATGAVDRCYQIAVAFDISEHDGKVSPEFAAFGEWSPTGWKSRKNVVTYSFNKGKR